ncbi:MAG: ABC transporter substrate-binding protein [Chloroflexi bacterium]|nr:ABC transporter substrate-binding protein [Chloroflexota bacterium]
MAPESNYWKRFWRQRINRRRLIQVSAIGGAGLAVAGVVGCGDDDEGVAGGGGDGTPVSGGTYRTPLVGLSTGNPPSLAANTELTFLAQIPAAFHYSRLLKFDPGRVTQVNGYDSIQIDFSNIVGDACEGPPEVVDDGVTLNFKLRDNLNFHDVAPVNGRSVTAEDVKIAIDRFATDSPNRGTWLGAVADVTVTGEKTFTITLHRPFAPAFQVLFGNNDGGPWIIPAEVVDQELLNAPIGSGPWIFEEWDPDVVIRWRKNPDYYDAPKPYMDAIEALLISDPETIIQNLKDGNLDGSLWDGSLWNRAVSELPEATLQTGPEHVWGGAYFNFAEKPFDDVRVRQALSMSIDREGILAQFDEPGAAASLTHISMFDKFYMDPLTDPDFGPNAKYYKRDLEEAARLLAEAGYPNGIELAATTSSVYGPAYGDRMEAFGGSAKDANFRFNFDYAEYGGYISTTFFGEIAENELGIAPLQGSPMDPHNNFFTIFHPTSARHNWGPRGNEDLPDNSPAGDQELLDLWTAQAGELDFDKRVEIVREIQRNMAESMYLIPWPGLSNVSIYLPHVKNVAHTTRGYGAGVETLADLWLDTA